MGKKGGTTGMWDAGFYFLSKGKGKRWVQPCDNLHWRKTWTKAQQHQRLFFCVFLPPLLLPSVCVSHSPCTLCGSNCMLKENGPLSVFPPLSFCLWICLSRYLFHFNKSAELFIQIIALFLLDATVFLSKADRNKYFKSKVQLLYEMSFK